MEDIKIFKSQNLNIILFLCTFALFLVCVAAYFYGIIVMGWTNKLYGIGVFVFGVCMLDPLFNFMRSKIHGKPYAVLSSDEVVIEDGKMLCYGSHDELYKSSVEYREVYDSQVQSAEEGKL